MLKKLLVFLVLFAPPSLTVAKTILVAADGSGEFRSIAEALAAIPPDNAERTVIHLKPGTYQGPIIVSKNATNITFQGDDAKTTIITSDKNVFDPVPPGHDRFNPCIQVLGDGFIAENITLQNTSGDHGQALAARVDSDRVIFNHCRLLGWQDTLMVNNGRHYFRDCYIEGRVDFIYGSATAVFDRCEIHSKNGGHVTAASTPQDHPFGFVFLHCKLTGDDQPWIAAATNPATTEPVKKPNKMADLGRPWRPYAAVAYINCQLGDHIKPAGWDNWRNTDNEKTARYSEFNSTGPGANPEKRFAWTKQLTKEQADQYTITNILGGADHWDPESIAN